MTGIVALLVPAGSFCSPPPYPPSKVIEGIQWHWETYRTAAPGSDLWPVTWADDDNLYSAWGDGGGFGGTDQDGRVAMGFARIEGPPTGFKGFNINGGKNAEHAASFPKLGKTGGLLSSHGVLYAWINCQNGVWPNVDQRLAWSVDKAKTWELGPWVFPKGAGNFKPSTFLNCGRDYTNPPPTLGSFIYFYGIRQGNETNIYLGRVEVSGIRERGAFEFLSGFSDEKPLWSNDSSSASPVFSDSGGMGDLPAVIYNPPLNRFLLTIFHKGPGQLGIFDSPQPWGPWTTVAYYDTWADMGAEGHGLTCSFPAKWISPDGLTLWCVFSAYGPGARQGIQAHDRFNLVKASLKLMLKNSR